MLNKLNNKTKIIIFNNIIFFKKKKKQLLQDLDVFVTKSLASHQNDMPTNE